MNAFEEAWGVIKALEEQQGFTMSPFTPTEYGQENPSMQRRAGTIHPAILGMMERRQKKPYEWEIRLTNGRRSSAYISRTAETPISKLKPGIPARFRLLEGGM